ncbi:MAG: hypothetical protein OER77_09160, partial [Myxococcales bacterium]|nr:hypothetical protein [Myxococcales bacterium]
MSFLRRTVPLGALLTLLLLSPGAAQESAPEDGSSNRPRIHEQLDTEPELERAEPPPDESEEKSPSERRPLLILFLTLLGVGLALFLAERTRAWMTVNVPVRRVMGALIVLLRLTGFGLVIAIALELLPAGRDWILYGVV